MMMRALLVACVTAAAATPTEVRQTSMRKKLAAVQASRISPELDPARSKNFLKDYPDDGRPDIKSLQDKGFHHFNPPFPHVQESDSFDRDYVKDENSDNGEWQAQADYDRLKTKITKAEEALRAAKKREGVDQGEADGANGRAHDAEGKAGAAKVKADDAAKWRKELQEEEKAAEAKAAAARAESGKNSTQAVDMGPVERARANLAREEKEFEQCKKELEDAKIKLADLIAALEAKKKAQAQKDADEQAALAREADADAAEAEAKKKDADGSAAEEAAADKEAAALQADQAAADKEAAAKKSHLDKIQMTAAEAKAKLDAAQEDLEKAELKLKQYRGEAPGGVALHASNHRSGASKVATGAFAVLAVVTACISA